MGASDLLCTSDPLDMVAEVKQITNKRGVDVAIEAVGTPETWHLAARLVGRGGTVNFFGGCPNDSPITLGKSLRHYSEITCQASILPTPKLIHKALEAIS